MCPLESLLKVGQKATGVSCGSEGWGDARAGGPQKNKEHRNRRHRGTLLIAGV
jgi:hypothetical protein